MVSENPEPRYLPTYSINLNLIVEGKLEALRDKMWWSIHMTFYRQIEETNKSLYMKILDFLILSLLKGRHLLRT